MGALRGIFWRPDLDATALSEQPFASARNNEEGVALKKYGKYMNLPLDSPRASPFPSIRRAPA